MEKSASWLKETNINFSEMGNEVKVKVFGVKVTHFVFPSTTLTSMPWLLAAVITTSHYFPSEYTRRSFGAVLTNSQRCCFSVQDILNPTQSAGRNKKHTFISFPRHQIYLLFVLYSHSRAQKKNRVNTTPLWHDDAFIHRWLALCSPLLHVPSPDCQYFC